jgi:2-iminobutanoate/2-iminopropanoate deaminase
MTVTRINTGPGLPSGFPFSLATEAAGIVFISGMPALDSGGTFAPGSFEQEADRAWENVTAIAAAAGCGLADLLYVQVLLADIGDYQRVNDWWRVQFPDVAAAPARLTFQAGALPFGAKIELQAFAARPDDRASAV